MEERVVIVCCGTVMSPTASQSPEDRLRSSMLRLHSTVVQCGSTRESKDLINCFLNFVWGARLSRTVESWIKSHDRRIEESETARQVYHGTSMLILDRYVGNTASCLLWAYADSTIIFTEVVHCLHLHLVTIAARRLSGKKSMLPEFADSKDDFGCTNWVPLQKCARQGGDKTSAYRATCNLQVAKCMKL